MYMYNVYAIICMQYYNNMSTHVTVAVTWVLLRPPRRPPGRGRKTRSNTTGNLAERQGATLQKIGNRNITWRFGNPFWALLLAAVQSCRGHWPGTPAAFSTLMGSTLVGSLQVSPLSTRRLFGPPAFVWLRSKRHRFPKTARAHLFPIRQNSWLLQRPH